MVHAPDNGVLGWRRFLGNLSTTRSPLQILAGEGIVQPILKNMEQLSRRLHQIEMAPQGAFFIWWRHCLFVNKPLQLAFCFPGGLHLLNQLNTRLYAGFFLLPE